MRETLEATYHVATLRFPHLGNSFGIDVFERRTFLQYSNFDVDNYNSCPTQGPEII